MGNFESKNTVFIEDTKHNTIYKKQTNKRQVKYNLKIKIKDGLSCKNSATANTSILVR